MKIELTPEEATEIKVILFEQKRWIEKYAYDSEFYKEESRRIDNIIDKIERERAKL